MSTSTAEPIQVHLPPNLLSIPALSTLVGFISGLASSAQLSSLQFTAENAHRQPRTLRGWYFYQKTKNYKVIWAGVKGGLRKGGLLGGWTTAFVGLQEGIDAAAAAAAQSDWQFQGRRTASGALSGTLVALAMSSIYKLGRGTPRRSLMGLGIGALAGGLQDLKQDLDNRKLDPASQAAS